MTMTREEHCWKHWSGECEHIIRVAEQALRHEFVFDLNWDMEQTHEPVRFEGAIDWHFKPGDDPEFTWQFNRHRFLICIGQAYRLTGERSYVDGFKELADAWITDAPCTEDSWWDTWRTLETGIRVGNWSRAYRLLEDVLQEDVEFCRRFQDSLQEQIRYIMDRHSNYKYMSNWGILEYTGLFLAGEILEDRRFADEVMHFCLDALPIQLSLQIMDDGVQWEQSPMYHNEVLHCLLQWMLCAKRQKIALPAGVVEKVRQMASVNIIWQKNNHHQVMMGDSDDIDIRDLMTMAAGVFMDSRLKFAAYPVMDFESAWEFSGEERDAYAALAVTEPEACFAELKHSGNYYFRSDYSEQGNFLHFHNGTVGAGHGHCDKLHVDIMMRGKDVLVDSGRYSYCVGERRFSFKEERAHNVVTVDNLPFSPCEDAWKCKYLSQPVKQQMCVKDGFAFVQGGHLGYMRHIADGVFMNRKILYIQPDIFILCDEGYTAGSHTYQQYFHFSEAGSLTLEGNRGIFKDGELAVQLDFIGDAIRRQVVQGEISRHYNQKTANPLLQSEYQKTGFFSSILVLSDAAGNLTVEELPVFSDFKDTRYGTESAQALSIRGGGRRYVVVILHEEIQSPTDMFRAGGCVGFGNVVVFEPEKSTVGGTVLHW